MASLRKLLFILFIIFLNLLIGINCAIIGMISPIGELTFQSQSQVRSGDVELIVGFFFLFHDLPALTEVVEERGCHHTEFRLTCGNLESQLAILEASFIPHCTDEDDIRCKNLDENR